MAFTVLVIKAMAATCPMLRPLGRMPGINMLRNARYLCLLVFSQPAVLDKTNVTNSRSHDERRTAVFNCVPVRLAGWLPGMVANTANGGHSHGNADQDPDEGISAPGGKEGEISGGQALLGCVAMMIPVGWWLCRDSAPFLAPGRGWPILAAKRRGAIP
jgi:hypothetical protein